MAQRFLWPCRSFFDRINRIIRIIIIPNPVNLVNSVKNDLLRCKGQVTLGEVRTGLSAYPYRRGSSLHSAKY